MTDAARVLRSLVAFACCAMAGAAMGQDFTVHGYVDMRAGWAGDETAWNDGGLGKTRFGEGGFVSGGAALAARWQLSPSLSAAGQLQWLPDQSPSAGILDAYLNYRPVSITPWRWSVRAGAFFPPISLENDGIGWTSTWTLSPSAIDTWVGEELRTVGTEVRLEHRGEGVTMQAMGAVFRGNDPAGELLASRGWALGDFTAALDARMREPDVLAPLTGTAPPVRYRPFDEIDGRLGWYAGMTLDAAGRGRATLLYYDNRADPAAEEELGGRDVYAWRTRFWSAGAERRFGDVSLVAQAMHGSTAFEPVPGLLLDTRFNAGYVLAAWERGTWRPAVRLDAFQSRQLPEYLSDPLNEHGNALTVALNWRPVEWMRVTGEWLRIDSHRDQRLLEGLPARQLDRQFQLNLRLLY